jgi:protein SCO1
MKLGTMMAIFDAAGSPHTCERPLRGLHASYIPNIVVRTHTNQRAWFYDDLILKGIVLLHCMSVRDEERCGGGLHNLAKVQSLLGPALGKNIFIYSITTDPVNDTPAALDRIAEKYQARNGWLFLSGQPAELKSLRERLFTHGGGHDCSMSLLRYGNEKAGLWGGTPITSSPESIVERISWITPRVQASEGYTRGGPPELAE